MSAFDTIGLCAYSYRFNEFYTDHAHPFAQQSMFLDSHGLLLPLVQDESINALY
jgi:hypothetical protein